ncbi:hypothetical protein [Streptomyces wuyuanensis]|uniref:Uncharacterized protein n=1 Tax=Streptomyces wuyuanensis TaxID=1196353 RepID=A0A1G9WMB1_9ACTN|nr:hypothetical protein [Streptomyces wuyuanensis]SDM85599.1 hypothetical protein SAMN05444921_11487 [Streptomyces wuyuanensis]
MTTNRLPVPDIDQLPADDHQYATRIAAALPFVVYRASDTDRVKVADVTRVVQGTLRAMGADYRVPDAAIGWYLQLIGTRCDAEPDGSVFVYGLHFTARDDRYGGPQPSRPRRKTNENTRPKRSTDTPRPPRPPRPIQRTVADDIDAKIRAALGPERTDPGRRP